MGGAMSTSSLGLEKILSKTLHVDVGGREQERKSMRSHDTKTTMTSGERLRLTVAQNIAKSVAVNFEVLEGDEEGGKARRKKTEKNAKAVGQAESL